MYRAYKSLHDIADFGKSASSKTEPINLVKLTSRIRPYTAYKWFIPVYVVIMQFM